jgi:hypothetical protein
MVLHVPMTVLMQITQSSHEFPAMYVQGSKCFGQSLWTFVWNPYLLPSTWNPYLPLERL